MSSPEFGQKFGSELEVLRVGDESQTEDYSNKITLSGIVIFIVIVVDDDIDVRNWQEVIWAITTRMDPARDLTILENTPIDYLDFASPVSGLGSKAGFDATNNWPGETNREWGRPIVMSPEIIKKVDAMWNSLFI